MRHSMSVSEVKKGDIILYNGQAIKVRYVDISPKRVFLKSISGSEFSFPSNLVVEVMQNYSL